MIFFGERLSRQTAAQFVDPLGIRQFPTDNHPCRYGSTFDLFYLKHNVAVIQQESISGIYVVDETFITCADAFLGPGLVTQRGINDKAFTVAQLDRALSETADADLGALQVYQ